MNRHAVARPRDQYGQHDTLQTTIQHPAVSPRFTEGVVM